MHHRVARTVRAAEIPKEQIVVVATGRQKETVVAPLQPANLSFMLNALRVDGLGTSQIGIHNQTRPRAARHAPRNGVPAQDSHAIVVKMIYNPYPRPGFDVDDV